MSLRSLRARPLRSLLTAGAIVLGVGMVFGVLLLVGTISSTFDRLYDSIYGRTDVVVSGERSIGSLPEATIDRVRAVPGVHSASGNIWSVFRTVDARGRVSRAMDGQVYTVGVDYAQPDPTTSKRVAGRAPRGGREVELPADWAARHGVEVGEPLRLWTPAGLADLRVVGLFEFAGGLDLGGYGTASMPIDAARRLMDKPGVWDEISVIADRGASADDVRARLDAALGDGVQVATPQTKGDEAQEQLASLNVILYFFSGIALFVGAFLILNSFNMTVLQRMREIGTLRALGASRGRVAKVLLAEAVLLGAVGSVVGLGVGLGLALLLVQAMQAFGMPVAALDLSAWPAIAAVATGLLATVAGALWPALRAGRISPLRALIGDRGVRRAPRRRRAVLGVALFVPGLVAGGLFWFGDTSEGGALAAVAGIGMTMVMFVGMVLLAPYVVLPLVRAFAWPIRALMPAEGRLADDALRANPGRTAATAATLLVALSVVVVNATVASSFVGSISDELDRRFARDVTVQPLGYSDYAVLGRGIPSELASRIEALPETGAVARRRALFVPELPQGGQEGLLVAYDPAEWDRVDDPAFTGARTPEALRGLAAGGVAPAEAYAKAVGLEVGDRIRLTGPAGVRTVPVVAIADTLDGGGQVLQMSIATMAAVYGVRTIHNSRSGPAPKASAGRSRRRSRRS
jgi:putative ABC transport system permease protein